MDGNHIVSKSNALITSRFDLSLEEQRLILILASMVQPNDEVFKPYRMGIKEFSDMLKLDSSSKYRVLKKVTKNLTNKGFEIETNGELIQGPWLAGCKYINGTGTIEMLLSPYLVPYLLDLKEQFTSYRLGTALKLESKYSIRMYEIFKCHYFKRSFEISVDELKNILVCDGVPLKEGDKPPSNYRLFSNFKVRVLDPSIKDINEKTDIWVEWQPIKKGRKVDSISFRILKNPRVEIRDKVR